MSRSAADIVSLSSARETLFIGPLSAFPVQARRVLLRDRLSARDALATFLSRPGAEEQVRPYLRRWGIDAFAARNAVRGELADILSLAAANGMIAVALAPDAVVAFSRAAEGYQEQIPLATAARENSAALPDNFLARLFILAGQVPQHLDGAVRQEFEMLIDTGPEALMTSLVAMMIPGVNLAILGMSLFTLPGQVLGAIDQLVAVLEEVRTAKTADQLQGAAKIVAGVLAILMREDSLRRFFNTEFVIKGVPAIRDRLSKPAPVKKEIRKPAPKMQKERPPEPASKAAAKETAFTKSATERVLNEMYAKAPAAKQEIDEIADEIAAQTNGHVAKAPLKGRARALEKIEKDYDGDASAIKDLARNTIVVEQDQYDKAVALLKQKASKIKTIKEGEDPLGYTGTNSIIQTKAGIAAEIQVNTPEMIYAKEKPEIAKAILGEERYNMIAAQAGDGGKGHVFYEEYRSLPTNHPRRAEIEQMSTEYYNAIRKGGRRNGS